MFDISLISDVEQYLGEQRRLHQLARDIAKRSIKLAQLMRQMDNMMFHPAIHFTLAARMIDYLSVLIIFCGVLAPVRLLFGISSDQTLVFSANLAL